jgi:hypothetical protein
VLAVLFTTCENAVENRIVYYNVSVPQGLRIETAADLVSIGVDPNLPPDGEYYLGNNIDLSSLYKVPKGVTSKGEVIPYVWRAIGSTCRSCDGPLSPKTPGTSDYHDLPLICKNRDCDLGLSQESQPPFSGRLHGNGKTVSGLKLGGGIVGGGADGYEGAYDIGLFGYINGAYIHDLTVELANTEAERVTENSIGSRPSIGALVGFARSSRIENITVRAANGAGLYVTAREGVGASTSVGGAVGGGSFTVLSNITSFLPLDVDGAGDMYVGGVAGRLAGEIRNATLTKTGTIRVENTSVTTRVAGICAEKTASSLGALTLRNCTVTLDDLTVKVKLDKNSNRNVYLAGIGSDASAITDCSVDIKAIALEIEDPENGTYNRAIQVGGIAALSASGAVIERCIARFDTLKVLDVTDGKTVIQGATYVGGIAANIVGGKVSNCSIEGKGEITVDLPHTATTTLNVGGLAGSGHVSRSHAGALKIDVTTGTSNTVYVGGLTGNGVAEYSSIGSPSADNRATLTVIKTNTGSTSNSNCAYIGGISGQAAPSAALPFRYNYAFCNVTLVTTAAATGANQYSQSVGGLVGYVSAPTQPFNENFAAGNVTVTDNFSGSANRRIFVGGIAGYAISNTVMTKCAALNGSVTIGGTTTASTSTVYWRRIAVTNITATTAIKSDANNITTVVATPFNGYSPTNDATKQDGLYVNSVREDTFFGNGTGQLGWNQTVWKWDESGYPVLR